MSLYQSLEEIGAQGVIRVVSGSSVLKHLWYHNNRRIRIFAEDRTADIPAQSKHQLRLVRNRRIGLPEAALIRFQIERNSLQSGIASQMRTVAKPLDDGAALGGSPTEMRFRAIRSAIFRKL